VDDETIRVLKAPYGSWVEYTTATEHGVGKLKLVWYGVEEVIDVERADGTTAHIYPGLGETARLQ
jgi:hypothetical protein